MTPVLEARTVSKRFGPLEALRDVSFAVQPGEVRALCGENGAGKSTLVKIFTGMHQPDSGTIVVDGREHRIRNPQESQRLGIAYVSQELSIAPYLSVLDNIWLGHRAVPFFHRRASMRQTAREALDLVGLDRRMVDRTAGELSLGERQLLEIARMLVRDARVLILDEPTATLSDGEIARVFDTLRRLRQNGRTVIFITHRLGEIFDVCDSVTVLRNGRIVGTHPVADMSRSGLIELMLGRPLDEMYPEMDHPTGRTVLTVKGLTVPGAVDRLSFELSERRIVCLAGQIGSGAAEAIRAVAGLLHRASGDVLVNGVLLPLGSVPAALARNVRYVSDDRAGEGLFLDLPIRDNLVATRLATLGRFGLLSRGRLQRSANQLAAAVGLDRRRLALPVRQLSGGNQQKIAIGRSLMPGDGGTLLMIEPTRGVDVGARADIYRLMRELCRRGLAILMTSTDLEEVVGMSDTVITMYRGSKVAQYSDKRDRQTQDLVGHPASSGSLRGDMKELANRPRRPIQWFLLQGPQGRTVPLSAGSAIRIVGLSALAVLALTTPGFTANASLLSFINTAALVGCVAVGMTFITLSGNIMSFSLGAITGATTVTFAVLTDYGVGPALIVAVLVAVGLNFIQGLVIGVFRANPIIVSIAALALIGGITELWSENRIIYAAEGSLAFLKGRLLGIPVAGIVFLLCAILAQALLRYTRFGQNVLMVGSSFRAASAAGVKTWRTVAAAYAWGGFFAGVSGILIAARYDAGHMEYGAGYDYSAIGAVLVGGTAIQGGQGSVTRSVVGVVVITATSVILLLRGLETQHQQLFTGLIVLVAVLLQGRLRP